MVLSAEETQRYARHLVLKDIGGAGQQKLKTAKVLVIGAGGLGSPVIAYLAAAGIGTLGIADDDSVSLSNLQRQVIHGASAMGRGKADSAADFVAQLNGNVTVIPHDIRLDASNAAAIFAGYDLVLDGSDNFDTRRIAAQAAKVASIPLISGAVLMWDGQVTVFLPNGRGFSDLYPEAPDEADMPNCEQVGVLGPATGVIGTLMAMEAIKLITGAGEPLSGRLLIYDGRGGRFSEFSY